MLDRISHRRAVALASLIFLLLATITWLSLSEPAGANELDDGLQLSLQSYVDAYRLAQPTDIAHAGDRRLFVTERAGVIRTVEPDGSVRATPFLSITNRVKSDGFEQGLLGLVFHPNYKSNGYFYVNYTALPDGETRIARFQVSGDDPNVADPGSELTILAVKQPYPTHNAGDLAFGPDSYLYVPLGDGGYWNDPENRAQNLDSLLGKLLRLDVDAAEPYAIPPDNPFIGQSNTRAEIWAYGLRNPFRISFDRVGGALYIADVGQWEWEELNWQPPSSGGGANYGWRCYEGTHQNEHAWSAACEQIDDHILPIFDYQHTASRCSIIGGFVYRGRSYPRLHGHYIFGDVCSQALWTMRLDEAGQWEAVRHENLVEPPVVTFGEDVNGELYLANHNTGEIFHIAEASAATDFIHLPAVRIP